MKKTGMQKNFGGRLKTQLIAAFMIIITVLMVFEGFFTYQKVKVVVQQQSADITQQYFRQNEHNLQSYAQEIDQIFMQLTQNSSLESYLKTGWREEVDVILEASSIFNATTQIMGNHEDIESVFYYGENGVVLGVTMNKNIVAQTRDKSQFYYGSEIEEQVERSPWETHWFGVYDTDDFGITKKDQEPDKYISIARSINVVGRHVAAVVINIDKAVLADLITYSDTDDQRESFLVDENGVVVVHQDAARIGENYERMSKLTDESQSYFLNREVQVNYHKLLENAGMPWTLVSEVPLSVLYQNTYVLQKWFILGVILGLAAAFCLSVYWLYRLTKPLDELRRAMKQMENGFLGEQLQENSRNELGMLGMQFNRMSDSIEELVEQIQLVENEKRVLEKEVLQAQINPHFLFNTLSNIKYMAMIVKSDTIVQCITALGNFLSPIYKSKDEIWTVREEISYIQNYITIMNYRFGNICAEYEYEEGTENLSILRFILQPLVENAIQHGFEEQEGIGRITIRFVTEEEELVICVCDNGRGLAPEELESLQKKLEQAKDGEYRQAGHIGLTNVHRRLKVYFGQNYGVRIESTQGQGMSVYVNVPLACGSGNGNKA